MKKKIIIVLSILALITVATTGAMVFNFYHSANQKDEQKDTYQGKLPQIQVDYKGTRVCQLDGYLMDMDEAMNRNCIIPVSPDRRVSASISTNKNKIEKISYELRSTQDGRLIDNGEVSDWKEEKGKVQFDYFASAIMEVGDEYLFTFHIQTDKYENISYHSRMMLTDKEFVSEQVKFAKHFSDITFDNEKAKEIIQYLEPDASLPNDNLGQTTIKSSYSMFIWNTLVPQRVGDITVCAKEFCIKDSGEAGTYTLNYQIKSTNAQKVEEFYNVSETITVWTFAERQYVLAYNREVNQIWTADSNNIGNNFIDLGIQNFDEAEYVESKNQKYLAFCINGDVYTMDITTKRVTPIYKLNAKNSEMLQRTRVKVLSVDDEGNVNYIIYGYSPAKEHVGKNGISVMKYSEKSKTSKEYAFLLSDLSASLIEAEISQLCHIGDGTVYVKLGQNIYYVNIQTKDAGILVESLEDGSYCVSSDGAMLAYNTRGRNSDEQSITIVNLDNGKKRTINTRKNSDIKVFGYTGENLVYGLASKNDVQKDYSFFPTNRLVIVDKDLNEVKTYQRSKTFISDVEIADTIIHIKRFKNGKKTEDDQLLFNPEGKTTLAYTSHWADDIKQKELAISFTNNLNPDIVLQIEDESQATFDNAVEIKIEVNYDSNKKFFTYGYGKLQGVYRNKKEAIKRAKDVYGLVTNGHGKKLWVFEENYN